MGCDAYPVGACGGDHIGGAPYGLGDSGAGGSDPRQEDQAAKV